jgi:hypothetical protein
LQKEQIIHIKIGHVSLDSTSIKVRPDAHGALKKRKTIYRKIPRRVEHKASCGCRE